MHMEIILKADVHKLGAIGKIVKVKDGYARNFLIPQGLAMPVTQENIKQLERDKQTLLQRSEKMKKEALQMKERLAGISLTMPGLVKESDADELYGSITAQDIEAALKEEGIEIQKSAILLGEPIRKLGIYEIPVRLHAEVTAQVKLWVVKK